MFICLPVDIYYILYIHNLADPHILKYKYYHYSIRTDKAMVQNSILLVQSHIVNAL